LNLQLFLYNSIKQYYLFIALFIEMVKTKNVHNKYAHFTTHVHSKFKKTHSNTSIDKLSEIFEKINLEKPNYQLLTDIIVQKIKENDILYFIKQLNLYDSHKIELDSQVFYTLGKYGSISMYNLLRNSNILEDYIKINNTTYLESLIEGIASNDNYQLFKHLITVNEFKYLTINDIKKHMLCMIDNKSYNCMNTIIYYITNYFDNISKKNVLDILKPLFNKIMEQQDCRMLDIMINCFKQLKSQLQSKIQTNHDDIEMVFDDLNKLKL
jgi:ribosomal protein S17E